MMVRPASVGDLTELRQHWPPSLLSGMTKRQRQPMNRKKPSLWDVHQHKPVPSRHDIPSGHGSAVVVPDSMVLCVEGDHPGLCGPSPSPAPRRLLCRGQHIGQVFSALDGDTFSLDLCPQNQSVRDRHGCDVVQSTRCPARSPVPCSLIVSLCGSFMTASPPYAESRSVAKRGQDSRADSFTSSVSRRSLPLD